MTYNVILRVALRSCAIYTVPHISINYDIVRVYLPLHTIINIVLLLNNYFSVGIIVYNITSRRTMLLKMFCTYLLMISLLPDRFYDLIILSTEWNRSVNYVPTYLFLIYYCRYWYLFNVVIYYYYNFFFIIYMRTSR